MQTFKTWLTVLGTVLIGYFLTMVVAVYSVVLILAGTRGEIVYVRISPWWGWSWRYSHVTEWGALGWGEPLLTVIVPLLIFFTIWTLRSRLSLWALTFAAVAMGAMGANLLSNTITEVIGAEWWVVMGTTKAFLVGVSLVLCVGSLILALPLASMLGLGRGRCSLLKTLLVVGTPILCYLAAMMAYHYTDKPDLRMVWIGYLAVGAVVVAVGALLSHLAAPLFDRPEVKARSPQITWLTAGMSLLVAAVLITLSALSLYPFAK
ncbi:hypothetical protein LCGC14_0276750 [marine sediment metagenome]|uniref:Uncharacterized protein n=1 Tax=marine sediment metagenome TaxID=412755 RepID=A0A0F9WIB1_9ZZZZ|nr:hypothetical protein [Phycisphaerae bacterium]HDZ44000.1 hypothetical protein [Phycisphaerae bacterium]